MSMTAGAGSASEGELLREESTLGPADAGSMFAAILEEMKKMNENILAISEPSKSSEGSPERKTMPRSHSRHRNQTFWLMLVTI